jgi:hypothetical protein
VASLRAAAFLRYLQRFGERHSKAAAGCPGVLIAAGAVSLELGKEKKGGKKVKIYLRQIKRRQEDDLGD